MNWATMQTVDPFRWALTGGYRSVDVTGTTILEKAWGAQQGSVANFPLRGTSQPAGNNLPHGEIDKVTPLSWSDFNLSIWARGNTMVFSSQNPGFSSLAQPGVDLTSITGTDETQIYRVYIRVRVCDPTTPLGANGLEADCVQYGSDYKPQGLLQQYSQKIRYSVFGYLNGNGNSRQGGVLREPMGFIGLSSSRPEWDASTGIMSQNPDPATATASGVALSGVMNYVNEFGEYAQRYELYDDVSELYYAVVRYYENMGNVPEWTNNVSVTELDGFPAVVTWTDPIAYSCQKNFILGIGDDHTWFDYNVGGASATGTRPKPAAVTADTFNQADTWTSNLEQLEGMPVTPWYPFDAGATYYIAGLAYGTHVNDIRPDLTGTQTISTYWMDVEEYQRIEDLNPYYLATKYGGFTVPGGYDISNTTTPLTLSWWDSGTPPATVNMNGHVRNQPDNYFLAGNAGKMVTSLQAAFQNIAAAIKLYTTSFSLSAPVESSSGAATYASQYDSSAWSGTVTGSQLTFAADGSPLPPTQAWTSNTTLQTQLAGVGWNTGRNIATWNGSAGTPFRIGNLTAAQTSALTPSYSTATTPAQYVNYLRGDQTNEVGSTAMPSTVSLRARTYRLGDIVDAKLTPVQPPSMNYSDANNPGYGAFKTQYASRPVMVYAAANDGMLHAFNGALTGTAAGTEQFAYVPSALYKGPEGTPQVDGLVALGNPLFVHHYYVDATPLVFDLDFDNAGGSFSTSNDWHSLLIGGLGKGGKSYYAIDVTDPASMADEPTVASKVQWEFTDPTMGFSFGAPIVVKTAKYGWVVALTSGYNNSDGRGYLYIVNPQSGALLEKIQTPSAAPGLAQASAYVKDYTDYTADSIYAGDLNGQVWRFDLTQPKGTTAAYPAPALFATLTDASGTPQPVTTAPLIEIQPTTRQRFVLMGTGELLSTSDISSTQGQTFYAMVDGSAGSFSTVTTPLTRSSLLPVTDLTAGITLPPGAPGWYTDLGTDSATGYGWRVIVAPIAYNGIVAFTTLLPVGDACSASGQSRVYAVSYGNGQSVLTNNTLGYVVYPSAITDMKIIGVTDSSGNVTPEIIAGNNTGTLNKVPANLLQTIATRLLNWREVPTAD